jgi:hypothetical protein
MTIEVWPDMFHAWQGFWMVMPEGKAAIEKLGAFLRQKLLILDPKNSHTLTH